MSSLYQRVGGEQGLERIVELMYDRILKDPALNGFFDGMDMITQRAKFRAFLNTVTEGPAQRTGLELRATHSKAQASGLEHHHFDLFSAHLHSALQSVGVEDDIVRGIMTAIECAKHDVLGL